MSNLQSSVHADIITTLSENCAFDSQRPAVQEGQLYNAEDGRKALRDVFALGLFDNVQVFPKPNQRDEAKVRQNSSDCGPFTAPYQIVSSVRPRLCNLGIKEMIWRHASHLV